MRFLLGVNYWPRNAAIDWWSSFSRDVVRADFAQIRDIGFDKVRIFLRWEDIQPTPHEVDPRFMRSLEAVCDVAAENNLELLVTFFTGHMSGANWVPEWLLSDRVGTSSIPTIQGEVATSFQIGDIYSDPRLLRAQRVQLRSVVSALRDNEGVWGWDLSNEPSNLQRPRSAEALRSWLRTVVPEIRAHDPDRPIVLGTHQVDLEQDTYFHPRIVAEHCDYLVAHGYPLYSDWTDGPLDPHMLPFLTKLTESLGGKSVLAEEFGVCTKPGGATAPKRQDPHFVGEAEQADYFRLVLDNLHRIGALGAFVWCFSDYERKLWHRPPFDTNPHELFFGITRRDASEKPAAHVVREFSKKKPQVRDPKSTIDVEERNYYECCSIGKLYHDFKIGKDKFYGSAVP